MRETGLFFLAIAQFQVVRFINNLVRYTEGINHIVLLRVFTTFAYYFSEIVMILCLCHSINQVLRTFIKETEALETLTTRSSLLMTDGISNEEKLKMKKFTLNYA